VTLVETEIVRILLWGFVATLTLVSVNFASQNLGWSRLNFPFLIGTLFTADRGAAVALGFVFYVLFGWFISFFYYLFFAALDGANWWVGALVGLVHGALLLTVVLPLLPYVHPRIATEYDGPTELRRLEPPGFLALHYGRHTPLVTLGAQVLYGAVLGFGFDVR
jgi:hypothetical protein